MLQVTFTVALLALMASAAAATTSRRLLQAEPELTTFPVSQCAKVQEGIVACPVGRTYSCCDSAQCVSDQDIKRAAKAAGVALSSREVCSLGAKRTSGEEVYYSCCRNA